MTAVSVTMPASDVSPHAASLVGAEWLPLPTLLSQTLVALTIELDNEAEHRAADRDRSVASNSSKESSYVSLAMWLGVLRYVGDEGVTVRDLENLACSTGERMSALLTGMIRWRYVTVAPDPADERTIPPRAEWLVRPTTRGRLARDAWPPVFRVVEDRWEERLGAETHHPVILAHRGGYPDGS
jgi:hypothetical protein